MTNLDKILIVDDSIQDEIVKWRCVQDWHGMETGDTGDYKIPDLGCPEIGGSIIWYVNSDSYHLVSPIFLKTISTYGQ